MHYQRLPHGYIFERLIGFSLPIDGESALISYDGVHLIRVDNPEVVTNYPELAEGGSGYHMERQHLAFRNRTFEILGLHGGSAILHNRFGERLTFGAGSEFFVHSNRGSEIFHYGYDDLSGDWRFVTFSHDDQTILLGTPYIFEVFRREA